MFSLFRSNNKRNSSTPSSPQPPRSAHAQSPDFYSPPASSRAQQVADSPISSAPPVLPPIPHVASTRGSVDNGDLELDQDALNDIFTPLTLADHRPSVSAPQSEPHTQPSYSLGLDFASEHPPPSYAQQPSFTQRQGHGYGQETRAQQPPSTPPNPGRVRAEPTFTLDPPESPEETAATSKPSRRYTSFADFGRLDFRKSSRLSTEPSQSSKSPSTDSRHNHDAPFLQPQQTSSPSSSISSYHKGPSQTNLAADSSPSSHLSNQVSPNNQPSSNNTSGGQRLSRARHLLAPVSMLIKRRTSQGVDEADIPVAPQRMFDVPALEAPRGYDPRIKGKRVHDFDEESRKPKRNFSTNDMMGMARQSLELKGRRSSIPALSGSVGDALGIHEPEKEHAPVFVENFDDPEPEDQQEASKAVQRETLANPDFLARVARQLDFDAVEPSSSLPPLGPPVSHEQIPQTPPQRESIPTPPTAIRIGVGSHDFQTAASSGGQTTPTPQSPRTSDQMASSERMSANPARISKNTDVSSPRVSVDHSTARSSISNDTSATTPPQPSPPVDPSRRSLTLEPPFQPTTPLKHIGSNASRVSRFSFQFQNDRSLEQERALEEKHKAKYSTPAAKRASMADSRFEELEDEDIDYDAMDDGGYEEDIPQLGDEDDDGRPAGLGNARWSTLNPASAAAGTTATRASSQSCYSNHSPVDDPEPPQTQRHAEAAISAPPARTMTRSTVISDDMYYDDGMIGPQTVSGASEVSPLDETRFDDAAFGRSKSTLLRSNPAPETVAKSRFKSMKGINKGPVAVEKSASVTRSEDDAAQPPTAETSRSSSLSAYHGALASATAQAAKDGKFSRGNSVGAASSNYTADADADTGADDDQALAVDEDDSVFGTQQSFDDIEEEDDQMVAAANAEVLASEDADFYGQEFGFYGASAVSSDGQLYNGGFFGQSGLLRAALNPRNNEPNLTPITERSEYSTRNSFIGSTPWGPSSSMSQPNAMSPGLKDLAAQIGMDDNDMTLNQLLRLRRAAFEGSNSSPRSVQGSSGSNDSSPTSQQNNSSPLAFRHPSTSHPSLHDFRRNSELELPDVYEAPEGEGEGDYDEAVAGDSPLSPNVTYGMARAVPLSQRARGDRRSSSEVFAEEYQNVVHQASPSRERTGSSPLSGLQGVPGRSSPPILCSPVPRTPAATSPLASPHGDVSSAVPLPSQDMMQKFANRPAPDGYRKSWEPSQRTSLTSPLKSPEIGGSTSVAYVREVDAEGQEQWYLERRREQSTGELVVLSREAVQGGRI